MALYVNSPAKIKTPLNLQMIAKFIGKKKNNLSNVILSLSHISDKILWKYVESQKFLFISIKSFVASNCSDIWMYALYFSFKVSQKNGRTNADVIMKPKIFKAIIRIQKTFFVCATYFVCVGMMKKFLNLRITRWRHYCAFIFGTDI